jgi:hypothetical protein
MGFTWSQIGRERSIPCRYGEQRVCKGGALGAANAGSRAAASLKRHSRALRRRCRQAVLRCCSYNCMTCAGRLRCRLLLSQGRVDWGGLGLGRLRWRASAAKAGAQVPLQLLCIAAERAGGNHLCRCTLQSQWPAAPHMACICDTQQLIPDCLNATDVCAALLADALWPLLICIWRWQQLDTMTCQLKDARASMSPSA